MALPGELPGTPRAWQAGRIAPGAPLRPPRPLRSRRWPRRRVATGRVPGAGCGDGGGAGAEPAGLPQPPRLLLRPQYRRGDRGGRPGASRGGGFFLRGRCLRQRRPRACPSPSRGAPAWPSAGSAAGSRDQLASREFGRAGS